MVAGSVSKWSVVGWSVVSGSVVGGFNKTLVGGVFVLGRPSFLRFFLSSLGSSIFSSSFFEKIFFFFFLIRR